MAILLEQDGTATEQRNPLLDCLAEKAAHLGSLIYAEACRLRLQPADAEDVAQDALLASVQAARDGGTADIRNLPAWSTTVGRRMSINILRDRKKRSTEPLSTMLASSDHTQSHTSEGLSELQKVVRAAVAGLPKRHREIIAFCHLEQGTVPEAGQYFGITIEAARSRLFRARKCLKKKLISFKDFQET